MKFGFKIKGRLKTEYKYEADMANNLTMVIAYNFREELLSSTKILDDNVIEFKNSKLNYIPYNYAITIFNFSIDNGIVKVSDNLGRLVIDYKVTFIKGLIFMYLFMVFLAFMIIQETDYKFLSEETLVFLILPLAFVFFGVLLSMRFLNILLDKSLKNRYRRVKDFK